MKQITFKQKLASKGSEIALEKSNGKLFTDVKLKTTDKENYAIDTFLALAEIETVFEQLEQTPYFLSNFRQTKTLKKREITRFNHIIYHIESFLFRTTGIIDRMLLLLNVIFETKLPPEKCKQPNFLLNKNGKNGKYAHIIIKRDSELFLELNLFATLIQDFRNIRNEITHQKRFNSKDLKNIEMFHLVMQNAEMKKYKYQIKDETDKVVFTYKNWMLDFNKKIKIHLDKIYEHLDIIWTEEYDKK